MRVISADGAQLGIMSSRDAQLKARDAGLDLVEISPNANPPVVKIIDWGKYQYQKMKEQARAKKKAERKRAESPVPPSLPVSYEQETFLIEEIGPDTDTNPDADTSQADTN